MGKKTNAYVDTSAFIAFLDRSDSFHLLFARLFSDPPALITTALVVAEGHAWFLKRYDRARAIEFINFIDTLPMLSIKSVGQEELNIASNYIRKYSDKDLTVVDAMGLMLMDSLKLRSCWSTDRHLALSGVKLAIHN